MQISGETAHYVLSHLDLHCLQKHIIASDSDRVKAAFSKIRVIRTQLLAEGWSSSLIEKACSIILPNIWLERYRLTVVF